MGDYSSRRQPPLSFMGCAIETTAGNGSGGVNGQLNSEPPLPSYTQRPLPHGCDQQDGSLQSLWQDSSPAHMTLYHNDGQHDGSAHADQSAWYQQQVIQDGAVNPSLLTSTGDFQSPPSAYSQYRGHYLEIGGQFDWSTSPLVLVGAEQDVQEHGNIVNDNQYSSSFDFDAEQVLNEPMRLPMEGLSQVSDTFLSHHVHCGVERQEGMPMSAVLGRHNPVPEIVVNSLLQPDQSAFELKNRLDSDARHGSELSLRLPGGAPPSPGSVVSSDALRCTHKGCNSEFNGDYRRGNLARHCRLKHKGRVVQYKCEARDCIRVFKRQDARLKHYRAHHPNLAKRPFMLRKPSTSTGTGSSRGCPDSPQDGYSITSPCDSQSINDADTPAFSVGDDDEYPYGPCASRFD